MENVRNHRNFKLVRTEIATNFLVSELSNHTALFFIENLLAMKMRTTQTLMNKLVHLGLLNL